MTSLDGADPVQYTDAMRDPEQFIWDEFYRVVYPHVPFKFHERSIRAMADVIDEYKSPHRVYHDINHLADVLFELRDPRWRNRLTEGQYLTAFIALVLHDVVYEIPDPNPSWSNEYRSADLALGFIEECGGLPEIFLIDVQSAIEATKGHQPFDLMSLAVCWCDLWGFTKNEKVSRLNSEMIREEYLMAYTVEQYEAGRRKFLKDYRSPFKVYPGAPLGLRIRAHFQNITANGHLIRELSELNGSQP